MNRFGRWTLAAVTALSLGSEAFAATLVTGTVRVDPEETVVCTALNAGASNQDGIKVELLEARPTAPVPVSSLVCPFTTPGEICDTGRIIEDVTKFVFCKVTAPDKRAVRGVIQNVTTGAILEAR
jgi:hypothetical protein